MDDIKKSADELNRKLKKYHDNNQAIPQEPLYHYTSFLGLSGILQSKQLWLTDHKFLNDPSEIEHGKHIILKQNEPFKANSHSCQVVINLIWFSMMLTFIVRTLAYLTRPELVNNILFMCSAMFAILWLITFLNFLSINFSGHFSRLTALISSLVPCIILYECFILGGLLLKLTPALFFRKKSGPCHITSNNILEIT